MSVLYDKSNEIICHLGIILNNCVCDESNIEVEKVALLTYTLLEMGIASESAVIMRAYDLIKKEQKCDFGWVNPYDTSLCLNILSKLNDDSVLNTFMLLKKWRVNGMWGRNERDRPRLLATADVLKYSLDMNYSKTDKDMLADTALTIWKDDYELIGYIFKARAFLDISYYTQQSDLVDETLKMVLAAQRDDGSFKLAYKAPNGNLGLAEHSRLLFTLTKYKNLIGNSEINRLKEYIYHYYDDINIYNDYESMCYLGLISVIGA